MARTAKQKAALRKAQLASARKRRKPKKKWYHTKKGHKRRVDLYNFRKRSRAHRRKHGKKAAYGEINGRYASQSRITKALRG